MKRIFFVLIAVFSLSVQVPLVFAQDMTSTEEEAAAAEAAATPANADQAQTVSGEETPTFRPPSDFGYRSPVGNVTIPGFISRVISFALGIVGAILLATFVYAGGMWMTAGGDMKKVDMAKAALKNAIIGMMIVALSYTIVTTIFALGNQVLEGAPAAEAPDTAAETVQP